MLNKKVLSLLGISLSLFANNVFARSTLVSYYADKPSNKWVCTIRSNSSGKTVTAKGYAYQNGRVARITNDLARQNCQGAAAWTP